MTGPAERPTVVIDLNVRVRGNETYSALRHVTGDVAVGTEVRALEEESGWESTGIITEIDHDKRLVYLGVDWAAGRVPGEGSP